LVLIALVTNARLGQKRVLVAELVSLMIGCQTTAKKSFIKLVQNCRYH